MVFFPFLSLPEKHFIDPACQKERSGKFCFDKKYFSIKESCKILVFQSSFSSDAPSHPFSSLSVFHSPLFPRLEIDRMLLDFLDDGFLLDFSFESF